MLGKGKYFLTKYRFQLFLFALVFAFFLITGRGGAVLFDDSGSYMRLTWREGVMPFYPLFLLFNQCIFGGGLYLWAVVMEQALLAAFSIVLLEETVRRRMGLHAVEGVFLSTFLLYPYTIEMPAAVMTQAILTEGVAYSFFYLFLTCILLAVWDKSYARLIGAFGMTLLLTAVRSQLQVVFAVCGIVFWYLICTRERKAGKRQRTVRFLAGMAVCVAVSLAGVLLAAGLVRGYKKVMSADDGLTAFATRIQVPDAYQAAGEEQGEPNREKAQQPESERELPKAETEEEAREKLIKKSFATSQYLTLIFSRGMYEADYEDAALFQDELQRGLYLALYEVVDAKQERYAYANEGLWMWKDIVGGIGNIGMSCIFVPSEYYVDNAPEIIMSDDFGAVRHSHLQTIGLTLIKAHFGRFLYHTLMLMPQAFISTVFFQYAPLYGFCHIVTAFLYLSAVALMIWGYADARVKKEGAEMMALVLSANVVIVLIISLVFFGQQRYLVYTFGPFYMAYYLLLRQLWCVRIRGILRKKLSPEKKNV